MSVPLSTNLDDEAAYPYFLWDDPITVGELKNRLRTWEEPERLRLLGKILREARDPDVWKFTTPTEVARNWEKLEGYLGRRKGFWRFLLDAWRREGLLRD